jgi:hypothetical protein
MTIHSQIILDTAMPGAADEDTSAYLEAYRDAEIRAGHSYFAQHIVRDTDGHYWVADEGAYSPLPPELCDRIVHTVEARLSDEY